MKCAFFIGFLIFWMNFGLAQDSLLITNHYSVYEEIECCKKSKDQLKCIDSLIAANQILKRTGNSARQFIKQKKAIYIYHINAGWINNSRGNYKAGRGNFKIAEKYVDSLKLWEHYDDDIERIDTYLVDFQKQWCFNLYKKDTAAFYTCDCAHFFPELNEEEVVSEEIITSDSLKVEVQKELPEVQFRNLFGQFYLNDTLRIDPRFVCDSVSRKYFEIIQSHILSNLSKGPLPEILGELSSNKNTDDTLILRIDISPEPNNLSKKCSIAYSNCPDFLLQTYLYSFMNMDISLIPRQNVSFYVPIVIKSVESDIFYNLNQTILENDHFLIQFEKVRPLDPK